MNEPISVITSRTVVMPQANIDTDQIIPARFLTTTSRQGLGEFAFSDWRFDADGNPISSFVLNDPENQGNQILVAGPNFGCGSSREHAPWALLDYGFRAVVSCEIADIFRQNSLKNGLLPVVVDKQSHQRLLESPGASITVDLNAQTVSLPDGSAATFEIDAFSRYCLMKGIDQLGFLLEADSDISRYEAARA